jgi:hypothetical protein
MQGQSDLAKSHIHIQYQNTKMESILNCVDIRAAQRKNFLAQRTAISQQSKEGGTITAFALANLHA